MQQVGKIKSLIHNQNTIELAFENEKGKLVFWKNNLVRLMIDATGEFNDETQGKIVAHTEEEFLNKHGVPQVSVVEEADCYKVSTPEVILYLHKEPFRVEAYKADGQTCIFSQVGAINYSEESIEQTFVGDDQEYFYGCGVQNGHFSHKNKKIDIELKISHWNAGSVSSPAPFYMSTKGYGQFRNTFKKGQYDFGEQTVITHDEGKMDTFYFFGEGLAEVLDGYTELTGRCPIIPRWGFMPGDANCYKETMDALKVANAYIENDIPRGWILPNDGYGCGYTDLKGFVNEAEKIGFKVGLWTENSMDKIAQEVSEFGSRLVKTDVAWVGPGYEFGLDGVKVCYEGIENNSEDRGYVWTCCGWAGSQRYSTVWSGDQFGNWEYIRMHIPTYIGAGLSGHTYCGSDIDGIFAGSADTQVRDLQWKCFTPILINMSGWAPKDKQPWVFGEPYTTYNRNYLNLKLRLTPYMYSYAYQSYVDGSPIIRAMLWQYPNEYTLTKDTQYQFMLGDNFLVAPIYEDTTKRDAIYLPDADQIWIDYFTGKQYQGGRVINSFDAPLEKLPLFVKNGAIIPMYPLGKFDGDKLPDETYPLTFDIYPYGTSTFEIYEDDGKTQAYKAGEFATTAVRVDAPKGGTGTVTVQVDAAKGQYAGMNETRRYEFVIHSNVKPEAVQLVRASVAEAFVTVETKEAYEAATGNVVYFEATQAGNVVCIKTAPHSVRETVAIEAVGINNDEVAVEKVHAAVPATPAGLEGKEIKDVSIVVGWDEVEEATSYDLMVNGILFENVSNPYLHRELEFVTDYTYQIRANNTCGASEWSEETVITTLESLLKNVITGEQMEVTATSERGGYKAPKAVNGDDNSIWLSQSEGETDLPAIYEMHFKEAYKLNKFEYKSRDKGTKGNITKYNLAISQDGYHYKYLVREGIWPDQDAPHIVDLKGEVVAKHVRIEALEGNNNYANAVHFKPHKVEGTDAILLGDYTGGGQVDENDLTFVRNYMGVALGDNDWGYVSKCDINYNDRIDVYDLAFVASQLEGGLEVQEVEATGSISLQTNVTEVKAGEAFEVQVVGHNLQNIYAFEAILTLDTEKYEHQNCLGRRCKKEVIATSTELSEHMINASALKVDDTTRVVVAFSSQGNAKAIEKDGVLAKFALLAKEDGVVNLDEVSTLLVGTNLKVIQ